MITRNIQVGGFSAIIKIDTVSKIPIIRPGFYCPECGHKMRVYWSRPVSSGCVVRMRLCDNCGLKTKTTES